MIVKCQMCGDDFNTTQVTVWQKVVGWEHKRFQGGTNHLAERTPLNEWRCDGCMRKARMGHVGQESLL